MEEHDLSGAPEPGAIRLAHTADLHLGAGLTYGRVNPVTGLFTRCMPRLNRAHYEPREEV